MTDSVDIAVRWAEAGQDVPARTAAHLQNLKGAAAGASGEIGDRMSAAFARLEAREPTMVLRRARFAIEELTASAIGFTGPGGRLAASFAMLGGATATGVVVGFAAIGKEVQVLINFSDELDKNLTKLNMSFTSLGGAAATGLLGAGVLREQEPTQPSWILRLAARLGDITGAVFGPTLGGGELSEAIGTGMGAEMATRTTAANLMLRAVDQRKEELARRQELKRISLLDRPDEQIRDLTANRARFQAAGMEAGQEWAKAWLAAVAASGIGSIHRMTLSTADFMRRTKPGELGPALTPLSTFDLRGPGELALAAQRPFTAPAFPTSGLGTHPIYGSEKGELHAEQVAERNAEKMAMVLGRELGPLIAAFSGGGARGAVAGLGGITGTLASLNDPNTGKALLGTAAPWLSLASGVLSGISSLFGGGQKPKVIITAFEEEAARQIKELRSDPATTSYVIVGPVDARQMQRQISRLGRIGVTTRFP